MVEMTDALDGPSRFCAPFLSRGVGARQGRIEGTGRDCNALTCLFVCCLGCMAEALLPLTPFDGVLGCAMMGAETTSWREH